MTGRFPGRALAGSTADLPVEAIAARTGYASNASLSKAFKRHFGVSPGTYRETHRHR